MLQLAQVGKVGQRLRHLSDVVEKKLLPATAETCLQTLPAVLLAWYQTQLAGLSSAGLEPTRTQRAVTRHALSDGEIYAMRNQANPCTLHIIFRKIPQSDSVQPQEDVRLYSSSKAL